MNFPICARRLLAFLATCAAFSAFSTGRLCAQTALTWDADIATAGAQDGSGTWNPTNINWYNATMAEDQIWNNSTTAPALATFGVAGGSGAVTVSGTLYTAGMTFNQAGYSFVNGASGVLNLVPVGGSVVFTTSSGSDSIAGDIGLSSTAGTQIQKTGPGTLSLSTDGASSNVVTSTFTVTGGSYNSGTGMYDSILSVGSASRLGSAPAVPTPQIILDAGTFRTGVGQNNSNVLLNTRLIQVNAAGGALADGGTSTSAATANTLNAPIINNAVSGSSLYLSNGSGIFTKLTGVISGTGGVTWNGLGTGILSAGSNNYTGPTVVNKGTLQLSGLLGNNNVTVAPGATLSLVDGILQYDLSNPTGGLNLSGNIVVSGNNTVRLATDTAPLTSGTYTAASVPAGNLSGTFQIDGANTLTVPAPSMIKNVGGAFYRLTLQNSGTAEQVVVTSAPANLINEMPLGSSITEGFSSEGATYTGGGYRSQLYQLLVNDGRFTPNFVGSNTVLDNSAGAGYNVLTGANQLHHEGHRGYTTTNILTNLSSGGNWLAPSNGVNPDYVTLSIGGNDYGASAQETIGPVNRTDAIVSDLQTLRPASHVILANLFYRTQTVTTNGVTAVVGDLQNTYYNPAIPGVVYNHVLAGQHVSFVDQYTPVTPNNNPSLLSDGIHPVTFGYDLMANNWYNALAFGAAYWTGSQDGQWSTVTADGTTNFAQNYQLSIPRQTVVDGTVDIYFNQNSAALPTALGQDLAVRGLNFAAGAAGPITVGGGNTLTLGGGGITVQSGTGKHLVSANIALSSDQTWGDVSSNTFAVSGTISGAHALTLTGSYTIQQPVSSTSNATSTQTYAGTGSIVLSGANTYTGGTIVSSGTLVVNNSTGSATGSGGVAVAGGATLTNNGAVGGNVSVSGLANGSGFFGKALTMNGGGTLTGAATVNGPLTINSGGTVMLSGGTLTANGGVVNNGTILLERGAYLVVGSGTFTNNGTLDILTGGFSAPGGFTNSGVVLDSSVIRAKGISVSGGTITVTMDGYTGHGYQLQRSPSLVSANYTNVGSPQNGTTGMTLTLTDSSPASTQGFYRVQVDP